MRPKSPFLQNLRKKTPSPKMAKKPVEERTEHFFGDSKEAKPFQVFQIGSEKQEFQLFSVESPSSEKEDEVAKVPPIDLEKERRIADQKGYERAKKEFEHYKVESEKSEKAFQEIANSMEEARVAWVSEVREEIAEGLQVALHHIIKNENLQQSILAHQLAEALAHLSEEKEMKVTVSSEFSDFAKGYLANKPRWVVQSSDDLHGGAILESENGTWDARLQVALDEVDHLIKSWLVEKSVE